MLIVYNNFKHFSKILVIFIDELFFIIKKKIFQIQKKKLLI